MNSRPLSTIKKDIFVLVNFKQIQYSFLSPEHSILTNVKINRNGFKSFGQDILAWRVQILEVEPFGGFQFHVNSGILGSVDVS